MAIETFTHGFGLDRLRFGKRNIASVPTETLVGNPPPLAAGRGSPDACFASRVDDCQSPLSLKFLDVSIRDFNGAQGIDDFNRLVLENHLRLDPKEIYQSSKDHSYEQLSDSLTSVLKNEERIHREKRDEEQGEARQREVASGAKGFIHLPSIAGERK